MTITSIENSDQLDRRLVHKPLIGVSSCLLGDLVRYDGGSKYHQPLVTYVTPFVQLHKFCPELNAGLGVPRQPVQLRDSSKGIEAVGVDAAELNVTADLNDSCRAHMQLLAASKGLCGYVLKARSPSCGLGSTPVYDAAGEVSNLGSGLFAHRLSQNLPHLVLVEESDLVDRQDCWRFLCACYLVWRDHWQQPLDPDLDALLDRDLTVADVWPCMPSPTSLANDKEAGNKKAVHWERLFDYWKRKIDRENCL